MSLFHQPKPRRFHHEPIYYDEHADRVRHIEEQARRELNMPAADDKAVKTYGGSVKGAFTGHLHERRHRNVFNASPLTTGTGALVIIILVLLLVWAYLSR